MTDMWPPTPDLDPGALTLLSGNLLAGGVGRSGTEARFEPLIHAAIEQAPDIVCFQECLSWQVDEQRLLRRAEAALGMRGVLGLSQNPRGMPTAILVRPPLRIAEHRVYAGGIWHHAAIRALIVWDAHNAAPAGKLTIASLHLHPHSPARRLLETEDLTDLANPAHPAILAGDFNTPDRHTVLDSLPPHRAARYTQLNTLKPDTGALDRLLQAGFSDVGDQPAHPARGPATNPGAIRPTPTTGHWPGKPLADRPDRILANPTAAPALDNVQVVATVADYSDHLWLRASLHPAGLPAAAQSYRATSASTERR